jgi:hypothetical protein
MNEEIACLLAGCDFSLAIALCTPGNQSDEKRNSVLIGTWSMILLNKVNLMAFFPKKMVDQNPTIKTHFCLTITHASTKFIEKYDRFNSVCPRFALFHPAMPETQGAFCRFLAVGRITLKSCREMASRTCVGDHEKEK